MPLSWIVAGLVIGTVLGVWGALFTYLTDRFVIDSPRLAAAEYEADQRRLEARRGVQARP